LDTLFNSYKLALSFFFNLVLFFKINFNDLQRFLLMVVFLFHLLWLLHSFYAYFQWCLQADHIFWLCCDDFCLFWRYYSHQNDYLEICRCYKAIYEIPSVKENPAEWIPVGFLSTYLIYLLLSDWVSFFFFFFNIFLTHRSWGKYAGTWFYHHMIQCSQVFSIPPWRIGICLRFQTLSTPS